MQGLVRAVLAGAGVCLLHACGGSGGTDGSVGGEGEPSTTLFVGTRSVSVAATPADTQVTAIVTMSLTSSGHDGLYVRLAAPSHIVETYDVVAFSGVRADLHIVFASPVEMAAGIHVGEMQLGVCFDQQCSRHVEGSPVTFDVRYAITAPTSVAVDKSSISATGHVTESIIPSATATAIVTAPVRNGPHLRITSTNNGIDSVSTGVPSPSGTPLVATFKVPSLLPGGTYDDVITVRACYDPACVRDVAGSPFTVRARYVISTEAIPEPGVPALEVLSRIALPHDVVDAEWSAALDAAVMVSARPRNSLYVYTPSTAESRELVLSRIPTAVSVAPDGLTAAVGHEALITHVNLATVGEPDAPAPRVLDVSADVFDLVLSGRGFVHAFPRAGAWVNMHSVEIATNRETLVEGLIPAGSRALFHRSGDYLYHGYKGVSPSYMAKADFGAGAGALLYDSPYDGDHAMCGNVWMKEDGSRIYTPCGNVFRASTAEADDMTYAGRLQLTMGASFNPFLIVSLSQTDERKQIALIEENWDCRSGSIHRCYTHLNLYESDFLTRFSTGSIGPVTLAGTAYPQRGMFVFHSSDGAHRYMISRLTITPNAGSEYWFSVLQ